MAKKVGGGGAIMQPYDKNGEYDVIGAEPAERNKNFTPKTKKGENPIEQGTNNDKNIVVDAWAKVDKMTITGSKAFKTIIEGKDRIEKDLDRLTPEQLHIFAKYIDKLNSFMNGGGFYSFGKSISFNQKSKGETGIDKQLGLGFNATTFYHEYGHFIDNIESRENGGLIWSFSSDSVDVSDDAVSCFNSIMKEGGYTQEVTSLNRIKREQYNAFYKGLSKITGKEQEMKYKNARDFGYIPEPNKPFYSPEEARLKFGDSSYDRVAKQWAEYNEKYQKYIIAENDGTNKNALKKSEEYNKQRIEHNAKINIELQRFGFLTDFFGLYTNNRINPQREGYWGHSGSYNKTAKTTTESWAEYFSFKMTNDKKGLDLFKKYLPKTFEAFENKYKNL